MAERSSGCRFEFDNASDSKRNKGKRKWTPFDLESNAILLKHWRSCKRMEKFQLKINSGDYYIDFQAMQQIALHSQYKREIRLMEVKPPLNDKVDEDADRDAQPHANGALLGHPRCDNYSHEECIGSTTDTLVQFVCDHKLVDVYCETCWQRLRYHCSDDEDSEVPGAKRVPKRRARPQRRDHCDEKVVEPRKTRQGHPKCLNQKFDDCVGSKFHMLVQHVQDDESKGPGSVYCAECWDALTRYHKSKRLKCVAYDCGHNRHHYNGGPDES